MEFLGIGYQEMLLVLVLLLVIVGPERLPGLAYQIGKAVKTMQRYARAVRDEFSDELSYIDDQVKTVKGELDNANRALRDQQREFNRELQEATNTGVTPDLFSLPEAGATTPSADATQVASANGTHSEAAGSYTNGAKPEEAKPAEAGKPPLVF